MKNENWEGKETRAQSALKHHENMKNNYKTEIEYCIANTKQYLENDSFENNNTIQPDITLVDLDSVSAIFEYHNEKTAVLNFASYKHPGGGFLKGSKAQEECLCHESILYQVLSQFQESYYDRNAKYTNRALYQNRALYSKDILFIRDEKTIKCDVITCASPNYRAARRCKVTAEENFEVLESRIKFVIDIAEQQNVQTLILGAYGCGVFGQNPSEVAKLFQKYTQKTHHICRVIFAIPENKNGNYEKFKEVFCN